MAHSKPSSLHNDVSPKVLEEAADWLTLLGSGEATTEDHQALAHWRSKSPMHQQAWQRAEAIMGDFRQASAPVARETLSRVDHSGRRQALKTLALLLLAAPVGWSGYRYLPWPQWQADLRTAKGEQQTHQLDDGSQLVLNTDTAVAINFSSQQRRIQLLAGEMRIITGADSAHNKRPFVVQTAEGQLTPLGTRFTVRQFDGHSQLAVFDGRVQIQPNHGSQSAIVNAGEQRLFSQSEIQPVHPASENRSLWEQGMLLAQDMPLGSLISELSRYRTGILRCDPAVANQPVSGAFPVTDTDASLTLLAKTLPITVSYRTPWWVTVQGL